MERWLDDALETSRKETAVAFFKKCYLAMRLEEKENYENFQLE